MLHIPSQADKRFILINCLNYITIIINFCAALTFYANNKSIINNPYPVVLCVTDNMSAKKWTTYTCKKSIVGQALARLFRRLMIGWNVGITCLWISTEDNVITDKISRLKSASTNNPTATPLYDYSKLQKNYKELKACTFFHPSQELLSLICDILLTRNFPDLNRILQLRPPNLDKLSISTGPKTCWYQTLAVLNQAKNLCLLVSWNNWWKITIQGQPPSAAIQKASIPFLNFATSLSLVICPIKKMLVQELLLRKNAKRTLLGNTAPLPKKCLLPWLIRPNHWIRILSNPLSLIGFASSELLGCELLNMHRQLRHPMTSMNIHLERQSQKHLLQMIGNFMTKKAKSSMHLVLSACQPKSRSLLEFKRIDKMVSQSPSYLTITTRTYAQSEPCRE